MKHRKQFIAALLVAGFAAMAAVAGSVYDRQFVALSTGAGTGTWQNTEPYAALKLVRIWSQANLNATNQVTATRIVAYSAGSVSYTQTIGTVTCSGSAGSQATLTAGYLKYGDTVAFTSLIGTGSVAIIEYEVQKH